MHEFNLKWSLLSVISFIGTICKAAPLRLKKENGGSNVFLLKINPLINK
jgi:hypothetical protein